MYSDTPVSTVTDRETRKREELKTHAVLAPKEPATTSLSFLTKAKPTQLCLSSSSRALSLSLSSHPPSIPFSTGMTTL